MRNALRLVFREICIFCCVKIVSLQHQLFILPIFLVESSVGCDYFCIFAATNQSINTITMKKIYFLMVTMLFMAFTAKAGGLMTNTNYHIAFDRMMARGASFDIDAAFSNPAGLAWGHEGWQLSLNFQKPWQNRDIELSALSPTPFNIDKKYPGKASAPIVPALFAAYKQDNWAVSGMLGIVGSGGFVEYDEGIPMLNIPIMGNLYQNGITPDMYNLDSKMEGKQYIYGGQLNFTYQLTDNIAAAVGVRANYYDGYNRGHVTAITLPALGSKQLIDLQLDCLQKGWGFTPIVSFDYHDAPLTIAVRYEFRTKINTENDTKELSAKAMGADAKAQFGDKLAPYEDGAKTRYDMPALLTMAVGYEITPQLRATLEYHNFDDKHAKMAGDRQKNLTHGTDEYLVGLEYDINEKFTVSCGGQRTDYGLDDNYQTNTSFACDSWSVGLGGAWNITEKVRLNAGYFCTIYSDYTKEYTNYQSTTLPAKEVYSRTNHVIGVGVDYKF